MNILFPPPLANAKNYPIATIKSVPAFDLSEISLLHQTTPSKQIMFTKSGRSALGIAAKALKREETGNHVLLPSYHCPALVEPFLWAGYRVTFYPVTPDLRPDFSAIREWAAFSHCVLVNFFGVTPVDDVLINDLAEKQITIIEDFAHALFDMRLDQELPANVAAQICSINKVLPTLDGGILKIDVPGQPSQRRHSITTNMKAWSYSLGITQFLNSKFKRQKANIETVTTPATSEQCVPTKETFRYFCESELDQLPFSMTKTTVFHSNLKKIAQRRVQNYRMLFDKLLRSPHGRPLIQLESNMVPYVLPFLANSADVFERVRNAGIQVLRWEEAASSACKVSDEYRELLLQIPCHQSLTQNEIKTIIEVLS